MLPEVGGEESLGVTGNTIPPLPVGVVVEETVVDQAPASTLPQQTPKVKIALTCADVDSESEYEDDSED